MEPSIKNQKTQAMKSYKRAKILYNLVLYTLTSIITCFFFSAPFWFPSIINHFFLSFPDKVSFWFNAKCFFVVANIIVFILVGESKLKQSSSSTSDIYDEYVARSRSGLHKAISGFEKNSVEEKIRHHEEKKELKNSVVPHGDQDKSKGICGESGMVKIEKPKGKKEDGEKMKMRMRSSKSAVWSESGMVKMENSKGKKEEREKIKMGMRSSKSAIWSEIVMVKMENPKGKKEEQEKVKMGMRSSKSAVWSESGMVKMEKPKGKKEEQEKVKMGMRSSKSAVWSESERVKTEKGKGTKEEQISKMGIMINEEEKKVSCTSAARVESEIVEIAKAVQKVTETTSMMNEEERKTGMRSSRSAVWGEREKAMKDEKKMDMRSSKSEIWSEGETVRLGKSVGKEEEEQKLNVLNKRVEDFIARVNKQRSLEAILVDHSNS